MKTFLVLLPIFTILLGFFIYRFGGRKELLKMDLVQFIYAFIITPTILIWIKTVVFLNLNNAVGINDPEDKFVVDTILTTFSFYLYAFIVMHSLTKTFAIKKDKDPLFDVFAHAEYFHLWLSHLVTYSGALFLIFALGVLNIFSPLLIQQSAINIFISFAIGILLSYLFYRAIWGYKIEERAKFDRVIKLQIYLYTFMLVVAYIIFKPKYSASFSMYWCTSVFYIFSVAFSQILRRSEKKHQLQTWGNINTPGNISLTDRENEKQSSV